MTFELFQSSISGDKPPAALTSALTGLWWDAKGDWARAHECAQSDGSEAGSWVHAYLHRKEGDHANAGYWYRQAGKVPSGEGLETEWRQIVETLLRRT